MVTIFAIPKAFNGKFKQIQLNAIKSWVKLRNKSDIEIILLGNEKGIEEVCRKYLLVHIPTILKNNHGTPLLNDCFKKVIKKAKFDLVAYANSDIILLSDFLSTINQIKFPEFLLTGRRYNLTVNDELKYENNWENRLKKRIRKESQLYKFGSLDYFIFPKKIKFNMPPFAVGRTAWDNWIVYKARLKRIPVIDASLSITAIHQIHDYSHAGGYDKVWKGEERLYNLSLINDKRKFFNIKDANYIVANNNIIKTPYTFSKMIRAIEKFPVLHERIGFLGEPLIMGIKIIKFLTFKIKYLLFK